ncbi:MAG: iron-containing alcohol dehydrogenase, partial [Planctomycetota bacterium]
MSEIEERASEMLKEFKGNAYAFGSGVLDDAPGQFAAELGKKAIFIGRTESEWFQPIQERILKS